MSQSTFLDLFDALSNPDSEGTPDPESLIRGLASLRHVASEKNRPWLPPNCRVKVVGDPEIVDRNGRYFHYLGPALLVNFNDQGLVRSLQFVGVEGGKKDSNYLKEVWHFDVQTQQFKYRDLRSMQGVPAHRIRCKDTTQHGAYYGNNWTSQGDLEFFPGDDSWTSEKADDAKPSHMFLSAFKPESETLFINCSVGLFARGPNYGVVKQVVESSERFLEPLIAACSWSPKEWMKKAADRIDCAQVDGKPSKPSEQLQKVQIAQLVFGLSAGLFGA